MYFTSGSNRAFESLMQGKPGFDHYDSGDAGAPEDCGDCRFYRPDWKYQFCVYAECPYQPGKLTAYDAVLFQVKGVDDEMAVFRVEKNRGYTVMSNHHLRNKDRLDEIVDLILETVCTRRKTIRVAGDDYPAELVKSKFMKLDSEHIRFVLDCLNKNTTEIRNIKQYLRAALFNAPSTIGNYYSSLVAHDMATGKI